jgi:PAS domain-containing protein
MLVHSSVGLLAVVSTAATTALVARRRSAPTATPLLGVCSSLLAVAVCLALVGTPSPVRSAVATATGVRLPGDLWIAPTLGLALPANGLWLLFAVGHTGRGSRLRRQVTAVVVVVVGTCYAASALVLSGGGSGAGPLAGDSAVTAVVGVLATGLFFTSALATLGSLFVLEAGLRRNAVPLGEGLTLAAGASLFVYAPVVAYNLDRPVLAAALLIGASLLLALAVERYPVFQALPVARIAARDGLVDGIDDGVVLVDERGRVVELNPAAASLFDVPSTGADRPPLDAVVPDAPAPAALAAADGPHRIGTGDRHLEVTASAVADEFGRSVGHLLVVRDVTERERRERRLRLLTRFLAGTVGDRTATVARRAARLTDEAGGDEAPTSAADASALAGEIRRTTGSLQRLVAATRRVERALSDRRTGPCDVLEVLRDAAAERDRASVTVEAADLDSGVAAPVDPSVFRAVVDLLLEALIARRHAVRLVVRSRTSGLAIAFRAERPPTAEDRGSRPGAADGTSPARGPEHALTAPGDGASQSADDEPSTVALGRLALEHAGSRIDRLPDGSLLVVLQTGSPATATGPADGQSTAGTTPGRRHSTGRAGGRP